MVAALLYLFAPAEEDDGRIGAQEATAQVQVETARAKLSKELY